MKTLMIPGTTEGHIYIQDLLCYISGIVLIKLRYVKRKLSEGEREMRNEAKAKLSGGEENAGGVAFDTKRWVRCLR